MSESLHLVDGSIYQASLGGLWLGAVCRLPDHTGSELQGWVRWRAWCPWGGWRYHMTERQATSWLLTMFRFLHTEHLAYQPKWTHPDAPCGACGQTADHPDLSGLDPSEVSLLDPKTNKIVMGPGDNYLKPTTKTDKGSA